MKNILKKRSVQLVLLLSIFSISLQAQRGLVLFGNFNKDYNERMFTTISRIIPADTTEIVQIHEDLTWHEISLPDISYMKIEGKFMKKYSFGGNFFHGISNTRFSTDERNWGVQIYFSHAENYNYLSFFKQKLKFYAGGELFSYWGKSRFQDPQFETSLSLSAYTSVTYLHKNRYWFELGLEKSLAGVGVAIPISIRQSIFRFNNHLDDAFYPLRIGFGLLF